MSNLDRLAGSVAAADPSLLAVDRATAAVPEATLPLRLVAALDLEAERYLAVVADAAGRRWVAPVVALADGVRRARPADGLAGAVLAVLVDGLPSLDGFRAVSWASRPVRGDRAITVDHTNESVVVGEAAVVKYVLHQPAVGEAVPPVALDRLTALAGAGFTGTPTPWGAITLDAGEAGPLLLATVVDYLPGARDGWEWTVEDVRRLARGELTADDALEPARRLGSLTARLHAALSTRGVSRADTTQTGVWVARALADLEHALDAVTGPEGERLAGLSGQAARALDSLHDAVGTPTIDIHGDLHVGQVLRHGDPPDYAVVDFDGSPVLTPTARAERQPAAVDVAGMLASLDHVGRVVVHRTEGAEAALVERWITDARAAFRMAYEQELGRTGLSHLFDASLLPALLVAQECREYVYAVRHLPHWVYVPDAALPALLNEV